MASNSSETKISASVSSQTNNDETSSGTTNTTASTSSSGTSVHEEPARKVIMKSVTSIINVPNLPCPDGYYRDPSGNCREIFG